MAEKTSHNRNEVAISIMILELPLKIMSGDNTTFDPEENSSGRVYYVKKATRAENESGRV